jgi:hypothetical protein
VSDNLVAGNDRQGGRRCSALDLVQFGVADAAGRYANEHLAGPRNRIGHVGRFEGLGERFEDAQAAKE